MESLQMEVVLIISRKWILFFCVEHYATTHIHHKINQRDNSIYQSIKTHNLIILWLNCQNKNKPFFYFLILCNNKNIIVKLHYTDVSSWKVFFAKKDLLNKKKWQAAKCCSVECSIAHTEAEYHIIVRLKEWVATAVCTHTVKAYDSTGTIYSPG